MKEICIRTSGHSRRCVNSGLTSRKKASIPQLLINHRDQTLLLCAATVKENTNAFQRGSSAPGFPCTGRSSAGSSQVLALRGVDRRAPMRAARQCCRSCWNTAHREAFSQGRLQEETSKNKEKEKQQEEKQTEGLDSFQRKMRVTLNGIACALPNVELWGDWETNVVSDQREYGN